MDATTGYDATQKATFRWPNGTVQALDDFVGPRGINVATNSEWPPFS